MEKVKINRNDYQIRGKSHACKFAKFTGVTFSVNLMLHLRKKSRLQIRGKTSRIAMMIISRFFNRTFVSFS